MAVSERAWDPAQFEGLYRCVHCGLCLQACPTYRELGVETDSPRGRLYLMRAMVEGRLELTQGVASHMHRCLVCRACETACPSGVPFGQLMELTRDHIRQEMPPAVAPRLARRLMLRHVFPHRRRLELLGLLGRLYQSSGLQRAVRRTGLLPAKLAEPEALMPAVSDKPFAPPPGGWFRAAVPAVSAAPSRAADVGDAPADWPAPAASAPGAEPADWPAVASGAGPADWLATAADRLGAGPADWAASGAGAGPADGPASAASTPGLGSAEHRSAPAPLSTRGGPARYGSAAAAARLSVEPAKYRVGLLAGCIMSIAFAEVDRATVRVLNRNGCDVFVPPAQTCCGALHAHDGDREAARALARRNIDAFDAEPLDAIIMNAAGCGAMMKDYGELLHDDAAYAERATAFSARVKDVSEFLAGIDFDRRLGRLDRTVTFQDPCHLAHGQRVREAPRTLLRAIPGLRLVEMRDSDRCCGSAGIYNLTQPELSRRFMAEKAESAAQTGAQMVVSANPGCIIQVQAGLRQRGDRTAVKHIVEILDEAYQQGE